MSSSAVSPSGSRTRWGGSGGPLIAAQRDEHQIPHATACRALGVSRSWFYKWKDGEVSPRAARRAALAAEVRRLFAAHRGTYGSPRITADLQDAGWKVSQNTVAALMREQGLAARRKKKRRSTTRPGKGRWRAPDLVKRDFPARQLNRKWYGDGTEICTAEGKLYLASVMDMASRRVLGHALGEHHDAQLACGALVMAVAVRGGQVPGVIFHSDRSPQDENPKNAAAIIGSNGQTYSADLKDIAGYTNLGNGTFHLAQGETLTGSVTFQVPEAVKVAKVR